MEVDTPSAGEVNISPERLEAFSSGLGKYRHAQNVEQMSSIADIEGVVKIGAAEPYSASEIMSHLKGIMLCQTYGRTCARFIHGKKMMVASGLRCNASSIKAACVSEFTKTAQS
ncbi:DNA replication licensing factor MCM3 homolog 2-like isoform X1 [Primulina huaijiensis]|uniref:DNA replication licensing factor MCM3 homolog 2-like isoform X1 n=1 Tax=Primulina huaijiensis TaxID=1492673 RepID=UPI003CC74561